MRTLLAAVCLLGFALAPGAAHGAASVGAPLTHGPDPSGLAGGPEAPGPSGGPRGGTAKPGVRLSPEAVSKRLPTTWCGPQRGTDDTVSETVNGGFKQHAVYMVPADAPDRFAQVATSIQT